MTQSPKILSTKDLIERMGLKNFLQHILLDSVDGSPDLDDLENITDVLGCLFAAWVSEECIHHLEEHEGYACADRIIDCCDQLKPTVRMHLAHHCEEQGIHNPYHPHHSTHNQKVTAEILLEMEQDDE